MRNCSKKCSKHCHFQESQLHTDDSESSEEEIPAAPPYSSQNTLDSSVDVDLSLFKNLSTILYRRSQATNHPRKIHGSPKSSFLPFQCHHPACNVQFESMINLKRHYTARHEHRPKQDCPILGCGQGFYRKDNLSRHLRRHRIKSSRTSRESKSHNDGVKSDEPLALPQSSTGFE